MNQTHRIPQHKSNVLLNMWYPMHHKVVCHGMKNKIYAAV